MDDEVQVIEETTTQSDYAEEILRDKGIITGTASYYMVPAGYVKEMPGKRMAIPPLQEVMACYYFPYIPGTKEDMNSYISQGYVVEVSPKVDQDSKWMKLRNGASIGVVSMLLTIPSMLNSDVIYYANPYKITQSFDFTTVANRTLFEFDAYPNISDIRDKIGHNNFDWRNEGKLYQYPYRWIEFHDGLMNPMYIEPQYLAHNTGNKFKVRQFLNPHGVYECYIEDYKNDYNGLIYPNEVAGLDVPVTNNAYLNYLNQNKNQRQLSYITQSFEQATTLAAGATQLATGNPAGVNTMVSGLFIGQQRYAQEADLKRIPNTITFGGAYQHGLQKQYWMQQTIHRINDQDMERIALYFHMYGYQQNKLMIPNIHNRLYWNYIKCNQCNLKGNGIPKDQLVKLKQIFEAGTTVWHIDNNATVGDYSKDNPEVY